MAGRARSTSSPASAETDHSGYPGLSGYYIWAMQLALNLGLGARLDIHKPLMGMDKARTWSLAVRRVGKESSFTKETTPAIAKLRHF
ncbi:7-cyano-7-deazaguanine synthase [Mesorhizobium kowhaii]|uniref:7-cyano-7-deazaguanine synthase n=1 Tax=Mesorhizobium kowhaii TaxID=1300272 RepID=UPI0035E67B14